MTDQQQLADRGRRECARFRDETKLALVGGLAEFADRLRDEWEAPALLAKAAPTGVGVLQAVGNPAYHGTHGDHGEP